MNNIDKIDMFIDCLKQLKRDVDDGKVNHFNININASQDIEDTTPPGDFYKRLSPTGKKVIDIRIEFIDVEMHKKFTQEMNETSIWFKNNGD